MLSTETLFLLYLSSGFTIGFGHCIGMCGPIVVSVSLNLKEKNILAPQLLYHLGRIITYAILGGVVAAAGSLTMITANIDAIQKGVMIFTGALIMLMGLAMAGWIPLGKTFGNHSSPGSVISKGFGKLLKVQTTLVYLPLGLLLGLLPCGPVYTALLGAARAGMDAGSTHHGVLTGMGLMAAFGFGTVPALFLVAKLADLDWLKSRAVIYKVGAVLMIIVGVLFVAKAIRY
ncbi:MAG: sulfite exporter TauE/SafE family protein [Desulfobacterales bacterium]|jgi:sulfite exporter TauE/SafE|nr:sulfite exporter TauE/SafE family protein [Desulfobacterales bacterium]MDH3826161.1 sulfite exporter TauE/SafE family protein [Desulfobacterales bacterium]